jgi:hypothetical protein
MEILKQIFTGKDNQTFDLGRLLWAKMSIAYVAMTAVVIIKGGDHPTISFQDWAIGAGAILAAGGGSLALKYKTEPDNQTSQDSK